MLELIKHGRTEIHWQGVRHCPGGCPPPNGPSFSTILDLCGWVPDQILVCIVLVCVSLMLAFLIVAAEKLGVPRQTGVMGLSRQGLQYLI